MTKTKRSRRDTAIFSHLDLLFLRDIGIEPQDVIDAMDQRSSSVWLQPMRSSGNRP